MRILILMDPGIPVPPQGYGGHERLVEMFAKEYRQLGHDVHLLVGPGSIVEGCAVFTYGKTGFPPSARAAYTAVLQAWKFLWKYKNNYDLVHNFGRLIYLLPVLNKPVKKIMTYGREISKRNIKWINSLPNKNLVFTGCSNNLVSRGSVAGTWKTMYNAIDFKKYDLQEMVPDTAPLIFLGRIERVKGCHTAIKVSKASGNKLIIAGNLSVLKEEQQYFEEEIKPHIDNEQIKYVGQLNDEQKNKYLGTAKALLFPIEWNEPFGMVMVEAMACGTPVIAFNKGSVNEVIDDGTTGFKTTDYTGMIESVNRVDSINRRECRHIAEKRFDVSVIAKQYLELI